MLSNAMIDDAAARPRPAPRRLALASYLDRTADRIECGAAGGDGFIDEDAVAVLRWSAAYLRRPIMRDDDLEGALAVFRRVLPGFDFSPPDECVVLLSAVRGLRRGRNRNITSRTARGERKSCTSDSRSVSMRS